MGGMRGIVVCPRCSSTTRSSVARFCNQCRVFLCPACSRKGRCPSKQSAHRVRTPRLRNLWWMGLFFAVFMLPFAGYVYAIEDADRAVASMPVTPLASLAPGTFAKVSGILESADNPVLYWTGTSRSGHWEVNPFNVTDGNSSIRVDISRIQGVTSHRRIQSGIHGGVWWPGDSISVVGDVQSDSAGNLTLLAARVAQSPTSFYLPDPFLLVLLAGGTLGVAVAGVSLWTRSRVLKSHERY